MLNRFKDTCTQSLLNKRAAIAKDDPAEEIYELHLEIQEYEKQFKECVKIASYILGKNRELDDFVRNTSELAKFRQQVNANKLEINALNEKLIESEC